MFTLTAEHLGELCQLNEFAVDQDALVFFGLRGCLPADPLANGFADGQALVLSDVDHVHPRCTIGQWKPKAGTLAVFPGSTVPHTVYIARARLQDGNGANQLMTGRHGDYRKGVHKAGAGGAHPAFRQTAARPVQRTSDDLDYQGDDRVETENPGDNLHAAYCGSTESASFGSAGCQVVVGQPPVGIRPALGPWKTFVDTAYALKKQTAFVYLLWNGREALRVATGAASATPRVRFGSRGPRARAVQKALAGKDFYEGAIDGDFGVRSLRGLVEFQRSTFGPGGVDGICGPQTLTALGVAFPA